MRCAHKSSAYTMVAISIDKYIAIMYPMRLRMPKTQAKIIILVIWSAALMTSLPTALLSSLAPASPDLGPTLSTMAPTNPSVYEPDVTTPSPLQAITYLSSNHDKTEQSNSADLQRQGTPSSLGKLQQHETTSHGIMTSTTTYPSPSSLDVDQTGNQSQQHYANEQNEEQKKFFCQESWVFWPKGKYYYSMALMILQFVLPLFVLVITYTRIVIVVWGKRMPGEEDDARDARMARSKRKVSK